MTDKDWMVLHIIRILHPLLVESPFGSQPQRAYRPYLEPQALEARKQEWARYRAMGDSDVSVLFDRAYEWDARGRAGPPPSTANIAPAPKAAQPNPLENAWRKCEVPKSLRLYRSDVERAMEAWLGRDFGANARVTPTGLKHFVQQQLAEDGHSKGGRLSDEEARASAAWRDQTIRRAQLEVGSVT